MARAVEAYVAVTAEEHGRYRDALERQPLLNIEPAQFRHAQVEHQTGGAVIGQLLHEERRRHERLDAIAARGQHALDRCQQRSIVVDDEDAGFGLH